MRISRKYWEWEEGEEWFVSFEEGETRRSLKARNSPELCFVRSSEKGNRTRTQLLPVPRLEDGGTVSKDEKG